MVRPGKLIFTTLLMLFVSSPSSSPAATFPPLEWAYPQTARDFKPQRIVDAAADLGSKMP